LHRSCYRWRKNRRRRRRRRRRFRYGLLLNFGLRWFRFDPGCRHGSRLRFPELFFVRKGHRRGFCHFLDGFLHNRFFHWTRNNFGNFGLQFSAEGVGQAVFDRIGV
jgi:hypothetical protein